MALLNQQCPTCVLSSLDLFEPPLMQTQVEENHLVEYRPVSTIGDGGVIEFSIPGSEDYLDLNDTLIRVRARVVHREGSEERDLTDAQTGRVSPVQLWLQALFSQVDVYLSGKLLSESLATYPYRAYLESLLSFGYDARKSFLQAEGWTDSYGEGDELLDERIKMTFGSKPVELIGKLHVDILMQPRLLLPYLDLQIRLIRSKDTFSLMQMPQSGAQEASPHIKIDDVSLFVRRVKVDPAVHSAHLTAISKSPALYPINRVAVREFAVPAGSLVASLDNVVLGQAPTRLILGFVDSKASNGDFTKNPFKFHHFNIDFVAAYLNGQMRPATPFSPNFDKGMYGRSFLSIFETAKTYMSRDCVPPITYADYKDKGLTLWGISLSQDFDDGGSHINPVQTGSLRIEVHFGKKLDAGITAILYLNFDSLVSVDAQRQVSIAK